MARLWAETGRRGARASPAAQETDCHCDVFMRPESARSPLPVEGQGHQWAQPLLPPGCGDA